MTDDGPSDGEPSEGDRPAARWPANLRGVTESVVTTLGPNDRWNVAALGLEVAPGDPAGGDSPPTPDDEPDRVTARTWGRTRTRRNFTERGEGYVQFTSDPVDFVEAALAVRERDEPVLESAAAWARVTVERVDAGRGEGTEWVEWYLHPIESVVRTEAVPTINRGFNSLVEATVVASRLGVDAYESEPLEARLEYLLEVVERCGGRREREALERLQSLRAD